MALSTIIFGGLTLLFVAGDVSGFSMADQNPVMQDKHFLVNNNLSQVATHQDLHGYADDIIKNHQEIEGIYVLPESVKVEVADTRYLLGIIPDEYTYTTEVMFDGNNGVDVIVFSKEDNLPKDSAQKIALNIENQVIVPGNTDITPYSKALLIRAAVLTAV